MLVVRRAVTRLRREMPRALDEGRVVRHKHAPAARRDDLVAVEREGRAGAKAARRSTVVCGSERFRRVLDDRNTVLGANFPYRVVVGALAVQIDGDTRGRQRVRALPRAEFLGEHFGIYLPR